MSSSKFTKAERGEIAEIEKFLASGEADLDDIVGSDHPDLSSFYENVSQLEAEFRVKMTPKGRDKMATLIRNFELDNDSEKVATAFSAWSSEVPQLFEGLTKFDAASNFLKMLEKVTIRKSTGNSCDFFPAECDEHDHAMISYIGGYLLKKAHLSYNLDDIINKSALIYLCFKIHNDLAQLYFDCK